MRANQDTVREFFEILADGASAARQTAMTSETLDKFSDISMQRRTAYQSAIRATGQARNTRMVLTIMVPGMLAMSVLLGSFDAMFHTTIGNVLLLVILGLLMMAYQITNMLIDSVVKGF